MGIKVSDDIRFNVIKENGNLKVNFTNTDYVIYSSSDQTFTVYNYLGASLPMTGGSGNTILKLFGILLMCFTITLYFFENRHKERRID